MRVVAGRHRRCCWSAYGVAMAVITITVTADDSDDPYAAMQTSGSSSILVGVGLATLAPVLLRWCAALLARPLAGSGAAGHLAAYNTRGAPTCSRGVLGPGHRAHRGRGRHADAGRHRRPHARPAPDEDTEIINLLNNVVIGMISLFAAIMVVNAFAAVVAHRRPELAPAAAARRHARAGQRLGARRGRHRRRRRGRARRCSRRWRRWCRSRWPATRAWCPTASSGCRRADRRGSRRCSPWPRRRRAPVTSAAPLAGGGPMTDLAAHGPWLATDRVPRRRRRSTGPPSSSGCGSPRCRSATRCDGDPWRWRWRSSRSCSVAARCSSSGSASPSPAVVPATAVADRGCTAGSAAPARRGDPGRVRRHHGHEHPHPRR